MCRPFVFFVSRELLWIFLYPVPVINSLECSVSFLHETVLRLVCHVACKSHKCFLMGSISHRSSYRIFNNVWRSMEPCVAQPVILIVLNSSTDTSVTVLLDRYLITWYSSWLMFLLCSTWYICSNKAQLNAFRTSNFIGAQILVSRYRNALVLQYIDQCYFILLHCYIFLLNIPKIAYVLGLARYKTCFLWPKRIKLVFTLRLLTSNVP